MIANKQLAAFFYTSRGRGLFSCNLCNSVRKQLAGSGYSNLVAHLAWKHAGYEATYASLQASSDRSLQAFGFVAEEASHLFQWVRWIIERNMPVHEKCMEGIAIEVGEKLGKEMGKLFALMLDGWTHAGIHYVALYAVYETAGKLRIPLLGISPLEDGDQTADAHIKLFKNILDVYDKTSDMVGFLVGDNCATNQSIATKMGIPLVGCASHRFNLAVNKLMEPYGDLLDEVNNLMVELRHENNRAELKKYTDLVPIKRNVTRWSSTFTMVEGYIRIRAEIKKVDAVEEMVPTGGKHRKLVALFEHLKKFESVCKRLQREDADMGEVRLMFDSLIAEYPVMSEHLKSTAKIVHTPAFESGVVKRLFSQCKLVLTPQRRSMLPANFEQLAFLRVNRGMWDVSTVARVSKQQGS
ncbi:hypothetical protein PHYSODRAFT_523900 [Phytophthora sojae]|uniref:BED-type domain-containing protein n=1 Tax=Phytophthora sojae (strain P6497) TaxID=1094619 RepID=G5A4S8_PHYSP|nr:hypothetical protein PHYSODRAFT_523900 [Phytophthora sojae]EGZ09678.1 hypothetical protein PHYSODRAFT_523900 [Phytophthora sojae]|eukprot:XP_009534539.1 hypothetical protein PHYSODRAFT_523900 [Phytophthora sojae]